MVKDLKHDKKATHVLMGGMVFPWSAKAPYVPSGQSALGALEYNLSSDEIKCHICGQWFVQLSRHVISQEGLSLAEYRVACGLRSTTELTGYRAIQKRRLDRRMEVMTDPILSYLSQNKGKERAPAKRKQTKPSAPRTLTHETKNLRLLCQAQLRKRLTELALTMGRTPTKTEMMSRGLYPRTISEAFNMPINAVWKSLGFESIPTRREILKAL